MCERCEQKFETLITGIKAISAEAYCTAFKVKDELRPEDFDIMGSILLAAAADTFCMIDGDAKDPWRRVLEMIAKANGAAAVMFVGGHFPTPADLGIDDLQLYKTPGGGIVGTGNMKLPKKEDLS